MKIKLWIILLLMTVSNTCNAGTSGIFGIWKTEKDESTVEISRCGDKLCGSIRWLKNPNYTDAKDGTVGTPVIDHKNPDPDLRNRPVLGLRVLDGFTEESDGTWS